MPHFAVINVIRLWHFHRVFQIIPQAKNVSSAFYFIDNIGAMRSHPADEYKLEIYSATDFFVRYSTEVRKTSSVLQELEQPMGKHRSKSVSDNGSKIVLKRAKLLFKSIKFCMAGFELPPRGLQL